MAEVKNITHNVLESPTVVPASKPEGSSPDEEHKPAQLLVTKDYIDKAEPKEQANLARMLIFGLFGSLALHYIAVILFVIFKLQTAELTSVFNGWLPVLSGFVGSAVTYYFTQMKDKK